MTILYPRTSVDAPASTLTVGELLGIIFGGFGLLSIVVITWFSCIRWKDQRLRQSLQWRDSSTGVSMHERSQNGLVRAPNALRKTVRIPQHVQVGWESAPSTEHLIQSETVLGSGRRSMTRAHDPGQIDYFSLAPPQKSHNKSIPLRRLEGPVLSAIIESPVSQLKSPKPESDNANDEVSPSQKFEESASGKRSPSLETSPPDSPPLDSSPALGVRQDPVFSKNTIEAPSSGRCHSVPTILSPVPLNVAAGRRMKPPRAIVHARSLSVGSQRSRVGPVGPLPDLPAVADLPENISTPRISEDSTTSIESGESSILKTTLSPTSKAAQDFSERHPEMSLGGQIRENDPKLKSSLITGTRNISPRFMHNTRLHSAHGSLLSKTSSMGSVVDVPIKPESKGKRDNLTTRPRTLASLQQIVPEPSAITEQAKAKPQFLCTPLLDTPQNRTFPQVKVSASGSPPERPKPPAWPLSGAAIQSNDNLGIPRDTSQASILSTKSNFSNPFPWDSPIQTRRAAVTKSQKRKTHKRQNCIRISVNSPDCESSPKSLDLTTFTAKPQQHSGKQVHNPEGFDERQLRRAMAGRSLPVAPTFARVGMEADKTPNPLRASLTPCSQTLHMNTYNDQNESLFPDIRFRRQNPVSLENARDKSPASSACSIPVFPMPGNASLGQTFHFAGTKPDQMQNPPSRSSSPTAAGSPANIPGLTLLGRTSSPEPEFRFPKVDINKTVSPDRFASPSESLRKYRRPLRSALSPSPKSTATTQVSEMYPTPTQTRPTPLSSTINPMNTKPDFLPAPHEASPIPLPTYRPKSPQNLVKSIKTLRRMDSDQFVAVQESPERQQYLRLGRDHSPDAKPVNVFTAHAEKTKVTDKDAEKENAEEDEEDEWAWVSMLTGRSEQCQTPSPTKAKKSVAWGGVEFRERSISLTPKSLYDAEGFLRS